MLVEIFKNRWEQLSHGKPIVATPHLFGEVSMAGLLEIWNEFVYWKRHTEPTLPEEDRLFHTSMNDTIPSVVYRQAINKQRQMRDWPT